MKLVCRENLKLQRHANGVKTAYVLPDYGKLFALLRVGGKRSAVVLSAPQVDRHKWESQVRATVSVYGRCNGVRYGVHRLTNNDLAVMPR
jgi:hypothetical protein